jgi:hypothetical protein
MLPSIPSFQKAIVSQRRLLRAATVLAVAGIAVGVVQPVAAESRALATVDVAQAAGNDAARCQELYGLWQRYKGVSSNGSGRDVQSQTALQDCRNGHAEAGIAQLETLLRNDRIPVPPAVSSAAR